MDKSATPDSTVSRSLSRSSGPEQPAVLLTGAGGRLGSQLAAYLRARGVPLRALVRDASTLADHYESVLEWQSARIDTQALVDLLQGVTSVVHMASTGSSKPSDREETHLAMPGALLTAARDASVQSFVSVSSVKAIAGEAHDCPLTLDAVPAPNSDYGRFKLAAEELVRTHGANAELATYTLRLPMVYGSDPAGNFMALRTAARWGLPVPVAADNRRSLLFSENLFACVEHLIRSPVTPGHKLLHLADGDAISTLDFFKLIAAAQGNRGLCLTLSRNWATRLEAIPVLGGIGSRLLGSLQFDSASLNDVPEWQMPFTTAEAVAQAVAVSSKNKK